LTADVGQPGNNLAELPTGEQTLGGVTFQIGAGLIQLSGKKTADRPAKVEGIAVGRNCSKLYFLHATQYQAPEDTVVGSYTVTYTDASQQQIPIVYGKDVSDWWYQKDSKPPSRSVVAWNGDNDAAPRTNGSGIRLYLTTWNNPHPARKVVGIDFASTNAADAAPFCVAITAED
jgi:hypothetical protein